MSEARRAKIRLWYDGADITQDIAPSVLSMTYTDQAHGESDDLQVSLYDDNGKWMRAWFPTKGAKLRAEIEIVNWERGNERNVLPCGTFQIDEIAVKGPPSTVDIKATAVPITSSARQEQRTKGWEALKLSAIAAEIAKNQGLELFCDASEDPILDRRDQGQASDLAFLKKQCERAGLAIKVTDIKIVIFDEQEYEAREAVASISYSELQAKRVISYSFRSKTAGVYKGAKVQYHDPVQDEDFETYVGSGNVENVKQVLNINERVTSEAEAETLAEKRLHQANKNEDTGSFSLMGNPALLGGSTIDVQGFGHFDGKYMIDKATHNVSRDGGYTTAIEIHKGGAVKKGQGKKKSAAAVADSNFPTYGGERSG